MKIYKEIKRIAQKNAQRNVQIERLTRLLEETDLDGSEIAWETAELVSGLSVKDGYLYERGHRIAEECDDYYVNQSVGYCVYGHLYFKTDVPGQYVKVYFEC